MIKRRFGLGPGAAAWLLVRGVVFVVGGILALEGHLLGQVLVLAAVATTFISGPLARSRDGWINNRGITSD